MTFLSLPKAVCLSPYCLFLWHCTFNDSHLLCSHISKTIGSHNYLTGSANIKGRIALWRPSTFSSSSSASSSPRTRPRRRLSIFWSRLRTGKVLVSFSNIYLGRSHCVRMSVGLSQALTIVWILRKSKRNYSYLCLSILRNSFLFIFSILKISRSSENIFLFGFWACEEIFLSIYEIPIHVSFSPLVRNAIFWRNIAG